MNHNIKSQLQIDQNPQNPNLELHSTKKLCVSSDL